MSDVSEPLVQFDIFSGAASRSGAVEAAVEALAEAPAAERGAVHTKPVVASFILDLAGYREDVPLHTLRLLEPSFGDGVFLSEAVRRLLVSWTRANCPGGAGSLADAITAVEVHRGTFESTRARLSKLVLSHGLTEREASLLLDEWLVCDDFLLAPLAGPFDAVVGNPPYLRQDAIPSALVERYRRDYATVYDRADLYVPFIQRGVELLGDGGRLTYICADRWMKNKYGGPLRRFLASRVALRHVVGMHGADAFEDEVDAYPSVFTVERGADNPRTAVASSPEIDGAGLTRLARQLEEGTGDTVRGVMSGDGPWLLRDTSLLRTFEARFPTLAEAGCRVGIGVATGADRVFISAADALDVEPDRVLPLAMAKDVREDGTVEWSGKALANPFSDDGSLVDLAEHPRLAAYFERHSDALRRRYVARKNPARWYKTIDKVNVALTSTPKLLIPDIKGKAAIGYDSGLLYPHHNLYFVTSESWDLRALQAVLRSRVAEFQVASYAVKMRGGYLRFQAQYLRRVRIPEWASVSAALRSQLIAAATGARDACDHAARVLYALDDEAWEQVTDVVSP